MTLLLAPGYVAFAARGDQVLDAVVISDSVEVVHLNGIGREPHKRPKQLAATVVAVWISSVDRIKEDQSVLADPML